MPINFPSSPANNQSYTYNSQTWYWANNYGLWQSNNVLTVASIRQQYTANGTANTFTVTGGYSANNLDVYINGVKLQTGTEANVQNGSTFTILTGNPVNGSIIEVVGSSAVGTSAIISQQITANGSANSFAITGGYIANSVLVFLNGVKQTPGTDVFTTSGANVGFAVTPANNYTIDVYGYQQAAISASGLTLSTAQTTTSGTSFDFTSIPSWVKRITVMFSGVSTSGSSPLLIQIGSGSFTTSGYAAQSGNRSVDTSSTAGFPVTVTGGAAYLWGGIATIALVNSSTYAWAQSGTLDAQAASSSVNFSAGNVTLSGVLDRVRVTTVNGTDTFDAGSVNILYEG